MCGILGGISVEPFPFLDDPRRLRCAIESLRHRGPDDCGEHISPVRRSFLGHRRLSIIDLTGGHQPIANEAGDCHLCYNGEIYNFRTLQQSVTLRGHLLRTHTDGEPALHLYEDDAEHFAEKLRGMFAISILDERRHRLTLVRDRNGIKPLYYYHDGPRLIFASEIKAILALLDRPPAMDRAALRDFLRWKYIPWPRTIYQDIYKLPPGHVLVAESQPNARTLCVAVREYWQPDFSGPRLADESVALRQLDELLSDAVASHLESDVEVGALLSGGVDSSLVVALASVIGGRRLRTFSVGFEEVGFDQLPYARRLAEKYNTLHVEEHVRLDPLNTLEKLACHFDEPFADSSALACYRVCEVAARHVKVALTGDGGDETFAGYKRYEELLQAQDGDGPLSRLVTHGVLLTSGKLFSHEAKYLKRFRERLLSPLERHARHQELMNEWLLNRLLTADYRGDDEQRTFQTLYEFGHERGWSPLQIGQYVDLRTYLPEDILTKVDRTSMASSLECRVPLLDHTITEFAASLSDDLKIRGGVRKYLLKKLAERYVPAELLYRPKMGFRVPIRRWFKRDLLPRLEKLLADGALVSHGILDPVGLRWMLRAQRRPWIDFGSALWALACLETWAKQSPCLNLGFAKPFSIAH